MHFRIHRDRQYRDAAVIVHTGGCWDCLVCADGIDNLPDDKFCWYCRNERGDWICDCGRKNGRGDRECSECGVSKPRD